jgi:hypothetical protein
MKRRMFKGAGLSLCAMLLLAGCSCKKEETPDTTANIKNPDDAIVSGLKDGVKSINLKAVYDELKASQGNEVAANKLLKMVSDIVLYNPQWKETWEKRYEDKVKEKLSQFEKDSKYFDSNGVFDEELLVRTLNSQLYNVTCTDNNYGPTYKDGEIEKYMVCNYTDYVEKALKVEIITELLNEKYVYDKVMVDKENILSTKKARLVEYVAISYEDEKEEDELIAHITQAVADLDKENSEVSLEDIADAWKAKKIAKLGEKFDKINTKDDANGSIMQEFTYGYTMSADDGKKLKEKEIYKIKNYDRTIITGDKNDILNTTLVERILSENVLSATANKTVELEDGNFYVVGPWAGNNVTSADIRIKDATNKKYYIVKVDVINNQSSKDLIYEAVKVLATNTSLVSDSFNYYLEQNKDKINIYDEEIYTYLKTLYPDIFVD